MQLGEKGEGEKKTQHNVRVKMLLLPGFHLKFLSLPTTFIYFLPNTLAELHFHPTLPQQPI